MGSSLLQFYKLVLCHFIECTSVYPQAKTCMLFRFYLEMCSVPNLSEMADSLDLQPPAPHNESPCPNIPPHQKVAASVAAIIKWNWPVICLALLSACHALFLMAETYLGLTNAAVQTQQNEAGVEGLHACSVDG